MNELKRTLNAIFWALFAIFMISAYALIVLVLIAKKLGVQ